VNDTTQETPVVFRVWKKTGIVVALFPTDPGTTAGFDCACFDVSHGIASIKSIMKHTRAATPDEYAEVKRTLEETYEYRLKVHQRITPAMDEVRYAKARRMRAEVQR